MKVMRIVQSTPILCILLIFNAATMGMQHTTKQDDTIMHEPLIAAGVLPYFTDHEGTYGEKDQTYFILAQESQGDSKDTYADFGGGVDKCDKTAIETAAREFWEEGILEATLQKNKQDIEAHVKGNTSHIISYFLTSKTGNGNGNAFTYVTDFQSYYRKFIDTFYRERCKATKHEQQEKNGLALVTQENLKEGSSRSNRNNRIVDIDALVSDGKNGFKEGRITLRNVMASKLKLFFFYSPKIVTNDDGIIIRYYNWKCTEDKNINISLITGIQKSQHNPLPYDLSNKKQQPKINKNPNSKIGKGDSNTAVVRGAPSLSPLIKYTMLAAAAGIAYLLCAWHYLRRA